MNIQKIIEILTSSGIEKSEANAEVKLLIEHYCKYNAVDIIMGRQLDYEQLKIVEEKAKIRAKTKQPIQYIIGRAYFMGDYYKVTPEVLIPRDDTEVVVRHAIDISKNNNLKTALDIGTGSGCIACNLSKSGLTVTAVDISKKALDIAKENSKNLFQKITFIESDLFSNLDKKTKFDLIISNPPYIPKDTVLQKEVTFEPNTALFADDNGLEFYKKIISQSKDYLAENGFIVFELGIDQSYHVADLLKNAGFQKITIQKDLTGIDRVISAQNC